MSIRNNRTGRHEDDLRERHAREGSVPLRDLVDHLNEIVVEDVSGQPTNVRTPVKMATMLIEQLIAAGMLSPDQRVRI